jgi:hypothetical protein
MSERMAAEIWIGGSITPNLTADLCAAIAQQVVSVEWGDEFFRPDSGDDLLAAVRPNRESTRVLWLCDDSTRWGEFDTLEPFLQRHEIPFTRLTAGRYEYDSERVEFRPDRGLVQYVTNGVGEPVIPIAKISEVESQLAGVLRSANPRSAKQLLAAIQNARRKLRQVLPPAVDPLPPFEIAVS